MNTSKNLAKHTYELLLSAINILVTFYCIYSKNMYIQYVVAFIMTFIAFLLFSAKRLSLKLYTACTIVVCLFLMLFLFFFANAFYTDILNAYITHLLLLCSSAYIRKKSIPITNSLYFKTQLSFQRKKLQLTRSILTTAFLLQRFKALILSYVILSTSLALFQNPGALRTNRFAEVYPNDTYLLVKS